MDEREESHEFHGKNSNLEHSNGITWFLRFQDLIQLRCKWVNEESRWRWKHEKNFLTAGQSVIGSIGQPDNCNYILNDCYF